MPTTLAEAVQSVYRRFEDSWSASAFLLENEAAGALPNGTAPWIRVTVREVGGGQSTLGPAGFRKYERRMVTFVQVWTRTNAGVSSRNSLASQVRDLLEGEYFDGLAFDDATISDAGLDGRWQKTTVEALFHYEEQK